MLHVPSDKLIYTSPIWNEIVSNKHKFYSKRLIRFLGYAKGQMLRYNLKVEYLNEFNYIYDLLKKMFKDKIYIVKSDWKLLSRGAVYIDDPLYLLWEYLPTSKYSHKIIDDKGNQFYEIVKKKFQNTVSIKYLYNYLETRIEEYYGDRAKKAAEKGGLDWKAITHGFRTLFELKQLIVDRNLTFPIKEIDYLKELRQGKLNYDEIIKYFNSETENVNNLFDKSDLPENPDFKFWEEFLYDLIYKEIENEY